MAKIFISYRRAHDGFLVLNLSEKLRHHFGEDSVFLDFDTIPLGADFVEYIGNEVGRCDILLAIISEQWAGATDKEGNKRLEQEGDYVRIEIEAALNRDIPVIPVLVGEAYMPPAADLPATIQSIVRRNAIKIRADSEFHHYIERLIRGLELHFKAKENPQPETPAKESAPKPKTRATWKERPQSKESERPAPPAAAKTVEPVEEILEKENAYIAQDKLKSFSKVRKSSPAPKKGLQAATEDPGRSEKEKARQIIVKGLGNVSSAQLFTGQIPSAKLKSAINSYAPKVAAQNVLLLYDNTVFGGAKQGLLLTYKAVHWQDAWGGNAGMMRFSDIKTVTSRSDGSGSKIFINDCAIQINQGDHKNLVKVLVKVILNLKARIPGNKTKTLAAKTTVISDDDSYQITIPSGWVRKTGMNPAVSLDVVDLVKGITLLVTRESRSHLPITTDLNAYVELVCNNMCRSNKNLLFSEFVPTTIGGFSALQFDVTEPRRSEPTMRYIIACIQTPKNYYLITGGTNAETYPETAPEILNVIISFREK